MAISEGDWLDQRSGRIDSNQFAEKKGEVKGGVLHKLHTSLQSG